MKRPYPSESISFWVSVLIWTAWMALILCLLLWESMGPGLLVITAVAGFICTLHEASRGQLIWRRVMQARAQRRRGNWRVSLFVRLAVVNIICFAGFLFVFVGLAEFLQGRGETFFELMLSEWRKSVVLVLAVGIADAMSSNGTMYERLKGLFSGWWSKRGRA